METLQRGWGSCRDFAVLLAEAARSLGFGARVVTGYLHQPPGDGAGMWPVLPGTTMPGRRSMCPGGLDRLRPDQRHHGRRRSDPRGGRRDIHQIVPVSGSFHGTGDDYLGMEVAVTVQPVGSSRGPIGASAIARSCSTAAARCFGSMRKDWTVPERCNGTTDEGRRLRHARKESPSIGPPRCRSGKSRPDGALDALEGERVRECVVHGRAGRVPCAGLAEAHQALGVLVPEGEAKAAQAVAQGQPVRAVQLGGRAAPRPDDSSGSSPTGDRRGARRCWQ